jgi:hypothetical protein
VYLTILVGTEMVAIFRSTGISDVIGGAGARQNRHIDLLQWQDWPCMYVKVGNFIKNVRRSNFGNVRSAVMCTATTLNNEIYKVMISAMKFEMYQPIGDYNEGPRFHPNPRLVE